MHPLIQASARMCLFGLIFQSLAACDKLKNLDEMHDSTVKMGATTEGMKKTTEEMKATTDELYKTAGATYKDLRQGNSLTIRSQRIEAMERASTMEAKISEAGKYMMAFELQLWKNFGPDNHEVLDALLLDAAEELVRDLRRYIRGHDYDTSPSSGENNKMNLYALSVSLHRVNPNAENLAAKTGVVANSMLDLIKGALRARPKVESGEIRYEDLPAYQKELLANEQDLVYLLRLRANFLPAMALSKIARVNEGGFLGIADLLNKLVVLTTNWNAEIDSLNYVQLRTYAHWIYGANETVRFLKEMGYQPQTDAMVLKILRNMRPMPKKISDLDNEQLRNAAIDELMEERRLFCWGGLRNQ